MKKTNAMLILVLLFGIFLMSCSQQKQETTAQIANPASEYCIDNGGKLRIVDEPEGQKGICTLPSGKECEEWAYFRKECS